MKLEFTERDRKLLKVLLLFLTAALYFEAGILPLHRASRDLKVQMESVEAQARETQKKLAGLAQMISVYEDNQETLRTLQDAVYPMLESHEIDRILTSLAGRWHLSIRKLEIQMPENAAALPAYSRDGEEGEGMEAVPGSVYQAVVLAELTGDPKNQAGLLDEIADSGEGLRILSMRRMQGKAYDGLEVLELKIAVLMCQKE